ncbi:MAG: Thiamine-monophosphate kinase [Verrucomicrobiae bacterium]|nr:Thiamine-monophosphate kinase [Verrucomicrobiae bacterium]
MKTIQAIGEFGLIRQLQEKIPLAGDDCAVLPGGLLLTCDPVIEGIHFLPTTPARQVGWKAMARNLSDIAAMGGTPRYAVVSLGLRPATPVRWVRQLYTGLHAAAKKFGCEIVGGDTAHTRREQFVVVTLLGHAAKPVRRSGAKPGDIVFVTGKLGGSFASGKHLTFTPRLREGRQLARYAHAMMDISDGLASDLYRLVESSHVGFAIDSAKIPGKLPGALTDGEDFELLFTVAPRHAGKLRKKYSEIGRVIKKPVVLLDGQPLEAHGYDHFAQRR